ncbi:BMC domain-containing protein [Clostridium fallax]|uniref:BMC domain-containing protein n=1 Tax=Clostridium fallax TaxID=1533 RepID=A0A1M4XBM7_9CLOT|nr:BMC domain-containing protein [Clostridium fallax]SHE90841.1 BMC domain-containing protein [Clostridium fallax]SQB05993.1 microcompartments protein [Clostridium fallax]
MKKIEALGIIEVVGVVASLKALDSMIKTSNVSFVTMEKKLGGRLVTVVVQGKVDSVILAIESGSKAANNITKAVAKAVIPKPHEEIIKLLQKSSLKFNRIS